VPNLLLERKVRVIRRGAGKKTNGKKKKTSGRESLEFRPKGGRLGG